MSVRLSTWSELDEADRQLVLQRPAVASDAKIRDDVIRIVDAVRAGGDAAVRDLTRTFDGAEIDSLRVSAE